MTRAITSGVRASEFRKAWREWLAFSWSVCLGECPGAEFGPMFGYCRYVL
jgi:hypothetical protein